MTTEIKTENIIATYTDNWNDEFTLVEIDGQVFKKDEDGELEAVTFDPHVITGSEVKVPMTREAVKDMGYEVCDDDGLALPSECLKWDIEQYFGEEATEKLMDFFKAELDEADAREQAYIDELKTEAEAMKD